MRRGRRELRQKSYSRNLLFLVGGFLLLIILTFAITFAVYNNKLKNSTYSTLTAEKIAELVPNDVEGDSQEVEQASTEIGKTIEEALALKNGDVVKALDGLPPVKLHCSVLAEEAIHEAIADYYRKEGKLSEEEIKIKCNLKEHHCESCGI